MFYILVAFLEPIFYSFSNIIESRMVHVSFKKPSTMLFYISLMNCVFLPFLFFFGMPSLPSLSNFFILIIVAVLEVAYLYQFYKSIKVMDISIIIALFSVGYSLVPFMSYLLVGTKLLAMQYVGFSIVIIFSIILSIEDYKLFKINKAFWYMLFASFAWAIINVLGEYIVNNGGSWIDFVTYKNSFSFILALLFLFIVSWRKDIKKNFDNYKKNLKAFSISEVCSLIAFSAIMFSMKEISSTVAVSIASTSPIFTMFFAFIAYKVFKIDVSEELSKEHIIKKTICFIFIGIGVYLAIKI